MSVTASITINQTNCGCDGAISIYAYDGTPPYSYSIDSGVTYKKIPLFSNLCGGLYYVMVKDSNDFVFLKQITLNKPSNPTTYKVNLLTTNRFLVNNGATQTIEYTTNIKVTPELPEDVYITFDLKHNNLNTTSPISSAATYTTNSTLTLTSGNTGISYTYTAQTITNNTIPGCQNQDLINDTLVDTWSNLTYYNGYEFELLTTTSSQKNGDYECYVSKTSDTFTIENLKIFGCNCCSVTQ
jgi:hypothetical protein